MDRGAMPRFPAIAGCIFLSLPISSLKGKWRSFMARIAQATGTSERALFVINREGIIHWNHVSPVGVNPGAAGILAALEELKEGEKAK